MLSYPVEFTNLFFMKTTQTFFVYLLLAEVQQTSGDINSPSTSQVCRPLKISVNTFPPPVG